MLCGQGSQSSSKQFSKRSTLVASYIAFNGCVGHSGKGAYRRRDVKGNRTQGHESCKCNHYGRNNYSKDYCWDLHGKSESNNQASCQDAISPPISSNPTPNMISISKE